MICMNERTKSTLVELRSVAWFQNAGKHDVQQVAVLASWADAFESISSDQWRDFQHEATNSLTMQLFQTNKLRYNRWNDVLAEIRPVVIDLVREKIAAAGVMVYPKDFPISVEWDIMMLLMEAEYSDVCPPKCFAALGFYYVRGHFPCGWEGDYPQGRLIVF